MEPALQTTPPEGVETAPACLKCGSLEILEGYANPLCADCRTSLIKYPIPLWVKLFGGGILVLLIIALVLSTDNFKAAFAFDRAKTAEAALNYVTEQHELDKVLEQVPDGTEVAAHMLIAAYYNGDIATYNQMLDKLQGKNFDDEALLAKVNNLTSEAQTYYPSEALAKILDNYKNTAAGAPDTTYQNYIIRQPGDVYARVAYASACIDKDKDAQADSILKGALAIAPRYMVALTLRSITLRELNQLDSSVYMCDQVLAQNRQSDMAMSSKARTMLKKGENKAGLQLALQTEALGTNLSYNKVTLAIAYHLNKDTKARDAILKMSESDSTLSEGMTYAKDVISGKIKFGKP